MRIARKNLSLGFTVKFGDFTARWSIDNLALLAELPFQSSVTRMSCGDGSYCLPIKFLRVHLP